MSERVSGQGSPITKARVSGLLAALWIVGGVGIAAVDPDLPTLMVARTAVDSTILVAMGTIIVGFVFMTQAFEATDRV